ncbi:MAG: SDR family NAD(P)-dependent oxidoreductase [Mesorhizobium sp.]
MDSTVLSKFRLDNKRALVTGGGRGLGREIAIALAEAGADIVLIGRSTETLDATAADITARGRKVQSILADMLDSKQCVAACQEALGSGAIDILVNNVGGRAPNVAIEDMDLDQWNEGMAFNLTHYFLITKTIGKAMIERGAGGRIINLGSISGQIVNRDVAGRHYETAKAAVIHFTRAVAADWARHGINANVICPGLFMTDANRRWEQIDRRPIDSFVSGIPMGRTGRPEEIGPLAVYLASPASSYVTGASFVIDGGYSIW